MTEFLRETEVIDRIGLEEGINRPTWYGLCASYIRGFRRTRHSPTSSLLPGDQRITRAVRRLYRKSDPVSRSVMDGTVTGLTGREKSLVFNRLVHQLAVEAQLAQAVVMPPEMEEEK